MSKTLERKPPCEIEVGDVVIVSHFRSEHIRTVDRITDTQIIVGESRFRRKDGKQIGAHDRWYGTPSVYFALPHNIAKVNRDERIAQLVCIPESQFKEKTDEQIKAIHDMVFGS